MQTIHAILPVLLPENNFKEILFYGIVFFIILFFLVKNIFSGNGKIIEKIKPKGRLFSSKENFFLDLDKIRDFIEKKPEEEFDKKYWEKLSKIFKIFISENYDEKIFFFSFGEIKDKKKFQKLEKIFEKFEKEFYFYEKKGKKDFLELIEKIKKI